jgi:hypothetical protein
MLAAWLALGASAALAQAPADVVVQQLRDQGYGEFAVSWTLLGRVRVVAVAPDGSRREIVFSPATGEILRDYSEDADGGATPRILSRPEDGGRPRAASSPAGGGGGDGGASQPAGDDGNHGHGDNTGGLDSGNPGRGHGNDGTPGGGNPSPGRGNNGNPSRGGGNGNG